MVTHLQSNLRNSWCFLLFFFGLSAHAQDSLLLQKTKTVFIGTNLSMPLFNVLIKGYGGELASYYFFAATPQLQNIGIYGNIGAAKMLRNSRTEYESLAGHLKFGVVATPVIDQKTWLGIGIYTAVLHEKSLMTIPNTYWNDSIAIANQQNNLLLGGEVWIQQLISLKKLGYLSLKATVLGFYRTRTAIFPTEAVSGAGFTFLGESNLPFIGISLQIWYLKCLYTSPENK